MGVVAGRRQRFAGVAGRPQAGRGHAAAGPVKHEHVVLPELIVRGT